MPMELPRTVPMQLPRPSSTKSTFSWQLLILLSAHFGLSDAVCRKPPTGEELSSMVSFAYSRSGGAGGQNVNKLNTKAEVRLDLTYATMLPAGVRSRLRNSTRATSRGELVVVSDVHRTQMANRKDALERLAQVIAAAWAPPKVRRPKPMPFKGKMKRLDAKKKRKDVKKGRSEGRKKRDGDMYDRRRLSVGSATVGSATIGRATKNDPIGLDSRD